MHFATVLNRKLFTPLQRQIYQQWREAILTGRFRAGERVPSTREMAGSLAVSRGTVSEAWEQLIAEGYLETVQGSGTFVCRELPDRLLISKPIDSAKAAGEVKVKLSRYGAGLAEDWHQVSRADAVIRFLPGIPDREHFPFALWRRLMGQPLRKMAPTVFNYIERSAGDDHLREEIAAYVSRLRAVRCSSEQIIIVGGSQQGLDLCARLLIERGDEVGFENPGYQGARRVFTAYGARLRPLSIDASGAVIRGLSQKTRLVYVTPSHQYPTGISMSLARRLELIEWAKRSGAVIVEDDYCSEYRYSGPPFPSLQGMAGGAAVVYIGTFSKVMFPGLRIGYIISPASLVPLFTQAKWLADTQTPMLEQAALAKFLGEGHMERHIRRMRRLYGLRREALLDALWKHFGNRARIMGDAAGMHAMVRFEDKAIRRRAIRNKVGLVSADDYYLTAPPGDEFIFGFSALPERIIREGIRRLAPEAVDKSRFHSK
jgi:GntR family transcriptional regulator / MocR family aminotransferase